MIAEILVESGGIWEVRETLELEGMAGLPEGTYTLKIENEAVVESSDGNNYAWETEEKEFEFTGTLMIDYELDQSEYTQDEILELSYTVENEGGATYSFEVGGCNPYVSFYDANTGELVLNEEDVAQDCTDDQGTVEVEAYGSYTGSKSIDLGDLELDSGVYKLGLNFNTNTKSHSFYLLGDGFVDIDGHWAESYVQELYLEGVVEGYSRYWFKPDQAITRAEFLKILFETLNLETEATMEGSSFADVEAGDWEYLYVESAYEAGIVVGYEDGTFAPSQNITRAEATSMVLASIGVEVDEIPYRSNVFTDVEAEWQVLVIMEAYMRAIVHGYRSDDNQPTWTFGPNDSLTRAEACKLAIEARNE